MTKTISLADDAYEALAALKAPGESFSDVARRLAEAQRRPSILEVAGFLTLTDEEAERFKADVRRWRDEGDEGRPRWP